MKKKKLSQLRLSLYNLNIMMKSRHLVGSTRNIEQKTVKKLMIEINYVDVSAYYN